MIFRGRAFMGGMVSGWLFLYGAVWAVLTVLVLATDPAWELRTPALITLVVALLLGLYVIQVVAGLRQNPDEVDAETIMRERRPGWEKLPQAYREEWEAQERARRGYDV
jgi:hypothetical protein